MEFDIVSPILGFYEIKKVKLEKIDDNFQKLIAPEKEGLEFTLINPFILREYEFEISAFFEQMLQLKPTTNVLTLNIVVLQKPLEKSRINFIAPLIFNFDERILGQVVLDNLKYPQYGVAQEISEYVK